MTTVTGARPPTSRFQMDRAVETLSARAETWAALPLAARLGHLRTLLRRTGEHGPQLVEASLAAKGVGPRFAGEDWAGGVAIQARSIRLLLTTLEGVQRNGRVPIDPASVSVRDDGQVVVRVTPIDVWDRVLFPRWRAEVWLRPEVGIDDFDDHVGSFYTKGGTARPGVSAIMGAGNQACITPVDAVHKLFVEGKTAVVKFNPVNDYAGPVFEAVFADLIQEGFVRVAYGGAEEGSYLAHHPLVTDVHLTGSLATHDAIVYGQGAEGVARKERGERLLSKRITSELGNVSPVIVVPGEWGERDLRYQAEHLATQMKQNDGFNCNAAKVLIFQEGWKQKEALLGALRDVLGRLPSRPAYYPGAVERWESFVGSHPDVELLGPVGNGVVPATLLRDVAPDSGHKAFREEAFCAVTATTELPGSDAAGFLADAVEFCNRSLTGTLNATILIDPGTLDSMVDAVDAAVAGLEYGSIGINIWGGAAYGLGTAIWGGFPAPDGEEAPSGRGFVHNALLLDEPQKSVVWAPFRLYPKPGWFVTHRSAARAMRYFAEFEADPGWLRVLKVGAAHLRG